MGFQTGKSLSHFFVFGVKNGPFNFYHGRFSHLVADHLADKRFFHPIIFFRHTLACFFWSEAADRFSLRMVSMRAISLLRVLNREGFSIRPRTFWHLRLNNSLLESLFRVSISVSERFFNSLTFISDCSALN